MHQFFLKPAVKGDEGPAAARTVNGIRFRKTGISTLKITEFHKDYYKSILYFWECFTLGPGGLFYGPTLSAEHPGFSGTQINRSQYPSDFGESLFYNMRLRQKGRPEIDPVLLPSKP
jgi:hypothetical protein